MFSRDDLGSGPSMPLLWVFGPLVLGALIVTGLGIAARATQGFPNIEMAAEIEDAAAAGDPMLAEVTDFEWDRVCVAQPEVSRAEVDELLGIEWGVVGGDTQSGRLLLVFVRDDEVVSHLYVHRGVVEDPPAEGDCRDREDQSTRL